jgi:hypothetical protein
LAIIKTMTITTINGRCQRDFSTVALAIATRRATSPGAWFGIRRRSDWVTQLLRLTSFWARDIRDVDRARWARKSATFGRGASTGLLVIPVTHVVPNIIHCQVLWVDDTTEAIQDCIVLVDRPNQETTQTLAVGVLDLLLEGFFIII